jgi:hypothetical protein
VADEYSLVPELNLLKRFEDGHGVVFGAEGGHHAVARNLWELLQILAYDCEISVDHDSAYHHRDAGRYRPSRHHEEYLAWLDRHFGLPAADNPDDIVKAAGAELGERCTDWVVPLLRG